MRALAATCCLLAVGAGAQPAVVPPKLGVLVLLKVLTYDAGFDARGQGDFVIAVPYSKGREAAATALVDELTTLEIKSIKQRKLVFRAVAAGERLAGEAVLLSEALSIEARRPVLESAHTARLYTLAFNELDVSEGALLGVVSVAGKLQPVINAATAKSLGVEFASSVLKVARTVHAR